MPRRRSATGGFFKDITRSYLETHGAPRKKEKLPKETKEVLLGKTSQYLKLEKNRLTEENKNLEDHLSDLYQERKNLINKYNKEISLSKEILPDLRRWGINTFTVENLNRFDLIKKARNCIDFVKTDSHGWSNPEYYENKLSDKRRDETYDLLSVKLRETSEFKLLKKDTAK